MQELFNTAVAGIFVVIFGLFFIFIGGKISKEYGIYLPLVIVFIGIIYVILGNLGLVPYFPEPSPTDPENKICPFCKETIKFKATVCKFCGRELPDEKTEQEKRQEERKNQQNDALREIFLTSEDDRTKEEQQEEWWAVYWGSCFDNWWIILNKMK